MENAEDGALGIAFRNLFHAVLSSPILRDIQGTTCLAIRYMWKPEDMGMYIRLSFWEDGKLKDRTRLQSHIWTVYGGSFVTMALKSKVMLLSYLNMFALRINYEQVEIVPELCIWSILFINSPLK